MRCYFYYKRGVAYGVLDIGINRPNDPRIKIERAKLEKLGYEIRRVEVW